MEYPIKIVCEPFCKPRIYSLSQGDSIYLTSNNYGMKDFRLGDLYNDKFKITEIFYKPRKWWQFWKKKVVIGYRAEYIVGGE